MPFYKFICSRCNKEDEFNLILSERNNKFSCDCGGDLIRQFPDSFPKVNLKGYNWSGKAIKENNYRKKRHKQMRERTKNHVVPSELTPNYKGEVFSSWEEVANVAKKEGKDITQIEKRIKDA